MIDMQMGRACAIVALLALTPACAAQEHAEQARAELAHGPEAAGRIADIAVFREQFLAPDRAYSDAARAEAERRLTALEARAGAVTQVQFELEIAQIVALADNGHTAFFAPPRSRRYNRVDVRLYPFGEDFYVLRATEANADLLGARLVAIDGQPIARARDAARTLVGGIPSWRDRWAPYFLESPEQMHGLGVANAAGAATYRFQLRDGSTVERQLSGQPPADTRSRITVMRALSPERFPDEGEGWRTLLSTDAAPWSLRETDNPFRWRAAPEIDGMVIEFRANNNAGGRTIAAAQEEFRAAIAAERPRNLVLDMRLNGGGDLNTTRDFMKSLPELVPGRIFVLTSPWTFSAAITSTGYLEQVAPERVTIVGEAVGDRLDFHSEGDVTTLPNSDIMVLNATERHDYVTGCRNIENCHGPVVRNPISVPTLAPDIQAPWTLETYLSGRDPAMDAVAADLR